jgi:hypothetical protein
MKFSGIILFLFSIQVSMFKGVIVMVLNETFSNILVISWRSVSLMEETEAPGENH